MAKQYAKGIWDIGDDWSVRHYEYGASLTGIPAHSIVVIDPNKIKHNSFLGSEDLMTWINNVVRLRLKPGHTDNIAII